MRTAPHESDANTMSSLAPRPLLRLAAAMTACHEHARHALQAVSLAFAVQSSTCDPFARPCMGACTYDVRERGCEFDR